jgi:hypothetical protein
VEGGSASGFLKLSPGPGVSAWMDLAEEDGVTERVTAPAQDGRLVVGDRQLDELSRDGRPNSVVHTGKPGGARRWFSVSKIEMLSHEHIC